MAFFKRKQEATKDPVCGMAVTPETAAAKETRGGMTYYFCSKGCQQKFNADPAKYGA